MLRRGSTELLHLEEDDGRNGMLGWPLVGWGVGLACRATAAGLRPGRFPLFFSSVSFFSIFCFVFII
jgi:hypothetical protein